MVAGVGEEERSQQSWPLSAGNRSKELSIQVSGLAGCRQLGGLVHSCRTVVHVAGDHEGSFCDLRSEK